MAGEEDDDSKTEEPDTEEDRTRRSRRRRRQEPGVSTFFAVLASAMVSVARCRRGGDLRQVAAAFIDHADTMATDGARKRSAYLSG